MTFKKVTWKKVLDAKCEVCTSKPKGREANKITKKFVGITYSTTIVCQGCISKMLRNFVKGL